jgi:mycothiol synthase
MEMPEENLMPSIRPLQPTDADYTLIAEINDAVWSDTPLTPVQLRHEDESWLPGYLYQRFVVEVEDRVVAAGRYFENHWQYLPGKYDFELIVHPHHQGRGIGRYVYDYMLEIVCNRTPRVTSIVSGTREDQPQAVGFLERRGFKTIMRWARARLNVADFDPGRFENLLDSLRQQGIEIASIQSLAERDANWQRKAYQLDLVAGQDAPSPDQKSEISFETYVENTFGHPGYLPEGCFAAVAANGEWIAMTELSRTGEPQCLDTPWSAVHPDYRRRGLATAVKVYAIQFAQDQGVQQIMASNEENNPMYQINLALGFQALPAALTLKKEML